MKLKEMSNNQRANLGLGICGILYGIRQYYYPTSPGLFAERLAWLFQPVFGANYKAALFIFLGLLCLAMFALGTRKK